MEPYAWRRIYTFCIRQPTSQHPVGSSLVIPKSPQIKEKSLSPYEYFLTFIDDKSRYV